GGDPLGRPRRRGDLGRARRGAGHVVLEPLQALLELYQRPPERLADFRQLLAEQEHAQDQERQHFRPAEAKHRLTPPAKDNTSFALEGSEPRAPARVPEWDDLSVSVQREGRQGE